ncbi:MAG: recombination protein RecR [Candidatus Tagabacteria bacterium CG09_land_8_20_14_0_10_41_14]|uniref:Recombination protein RecR n=2 Tax=Candidatus Tagaibacteriota TaxID=1817918 RepID=A0A2H0WP88_9BACT|nr:MAG: recombination protein RecR [Candidatus Tagabacteria bacterium CG09_land_8_20_14_0_10_41_14]PJE73180.1 MAG: recombination protein RecR [Candidatus Tagabacteria bacterium CG10_big_fil_rev_8_21_14_0_10_40_13]
MNHTIQKLTEYFEKFPGIGPRQARRFVYSLLNKDEKYLAGLVKIISTLKQEVARCSSCNRFFNTGIEGQNEKCSICLNPNRQKDILLITEKDVDLENIEKAGFYNGSYYILGGLINSFGGELPKEIKMKELFEKVKKSAVSDNLKEIILAFAATPEGENTTRYTEKILEPIIKKMPIKISRLGRGLSTGTELEYADNETIRNALEKRN